MGWCNGSYLAEDIYNKIREYIPEDKRKEIAKTLYNEFSALDADCWEFSNLTKDAGEVIICPECGCDTWKDEDFNGKCEDCYYNDEED